MFHSKKYIANRHGKHRPDRPHYLKLLVEEYNTTSKLVAKQQVLANLANFAYDPVNYEWLWQAEAIHVFLESIQAEDPFLREFGMGGLVNVCLDPTHQTYLLDDPAHLDSVYGLLMRSDASANPNIVLNALTTLMLLMDSKKTLALPQGLVPALNCFKHIPRVQVMVTLFLNDYVPRYQS
ncbi:hypothetical protein DM01DRAFT_1332960 [Hesseltinella vesiculosa]|uniref:ARM repeat-containing protein n=1 Tax=Hesseltinella vesiculosa TaxID=101127 RepID=A0A1X2GQY7_9FUNG|nr:hypothetical protein DM01DRAFT_1332960 [Hesseltinella vesiculosa]